MSEWVIDKLGRLFIPKALRTRLSLAPGMTLIAEEGEDENIWLRPQPQTTLLIDKGGIWVVKSEPLDDLAHITRRERQRRASELLSRTDL